MITAYKLVVVNPFAQYKRGDVITDQIVTQAILDVTNAEWHPYENSVRRVPLTPDEIAQAYAALTPAVPAADTTIQVSSVKDADAKATKR